MYKTLNWLFSVKGHDLPDDVMFNIRQTKLTSPVAVVYNCLDDWWNEAVVISEIQLDYLNHESSHQIVYVVCKQFPN